MSEDIAAIVKGLTKAQREAVLADPTGMDHFGPRRRIHVTVTAKLRTKGMIVWTPTGYQFTPLGEQVRTYLMEHSK